ncbi:MAG TPA: DUF642 domain-containing protein [Acidimicrobiales bacterium]|nr:DUF642 domain-containing protein [Acidimicrobiales bacterium]
MNRTLLAASVAAAAIVLTATSASAADPFVNGSFEDGSMQPSGPSWMSVGYGADPGTAITGWTETGDGVDWHFNTANPNEPTAQDGQRSVDLNLSGAIEQSATTTPGTVYTLSFHYAGHPFCVGSGTANAVVTAGAATTTVTSSGTNTYTLGTLAFTATASTTTVKFAGAGSVGGFGCGGVVVDNVSIAQNSATTGAECKDGGWRNYGTLYRNQGDCVSFVSTGGKNPPVGS